MSDLRIGQRCRLVNVRDAVNPGFRPCEGDEVTILGLPGTFPSYPDCYEISRPQHFPSGLERITSFGTPRELLRPLTDPGADAFLERIKKLGREPINETEKVTR